MMRKIKAHYFVNLVVTCAASIAVSAQPNIRESRDMRSIEGELTEIMNLAKCPGMSVAIVEKGEIVYANGFGLRAMESQEYVNASTLFAIGSCTKAFTSVIIGQLAEEALLDLDESPRSYIDHLEFCNDQMNNNVTVRDMLCHRTGLPRYDLSWYLFPSESKNDLIHRIRYQEPTAQVKETFQYNNFMYMTLGALSEQITYKSWDDNVRERILEPLNMTQSNLSIGEMEQVENRALGYVTNIDGEIQAEEYYHIRGMAPAGSINSNALEMGNWLITWINGGEFNGNQVIPYDYLLESISSQMVDGSGLPESTNPEMHFSNYGFAWSLSSYRGHYRVEHGGNINGFTASTCFFPSDSIGIVVMVNQDNSIVPSLVRNTIADKLLDLDEENWSSRLEATSNEAEDSEVGSSVTEVTSNEFKSPTHTLNSYSGEYKNNAYGTISIEVANDSLFAVLPDSRWWLGHEQFDVFDLFKVDNGSINGSFNSSMKINFNSDFEGKLSTLQLDAFGQVIEFQRKPTIVQLNDDELEMYVGKFDLGGAFAVVSLVENELLLDIPGQSTYKLVPAGDHTFSIEGLEGYSVEFVETDSVITAILFKQPEGTFKADKVVE